VSTKSWSWVIISALACIGGAQIAHAQARKAIDVPVVVGGSENFDACQSNGVIVGLDPNGDGFLSVRSGPGGRPYREIDRVYNGQQVMVCGEQGSWYPVVYTSKQSLECNVSSPWAVRQAYTGPCRYGWVHRRYVRITAG
jgi:hypothetical protein